MYRPERTPEDGRVPNGPATGPGDGIISDHHERLQSDTNVSLPFPASRPAALDAAACLALPLRAQDYLQDTLAVRIPPDQDGLTATPVTRVITAEAQRVARLRLGDVLP